MTYRERAEAECEKRTSMAWDKLSRMQKNDLAIFIMLEDAERQWHDESVEDFGRGKMNIFFDTEFTGLHKNTTLISIGLISADGRTFYAELTDYDENQCDEWLKENVINNLLFKNERFVRRDRHGEQEVRGTKQQVGKYLKRWLSQFDDVQFVSDVCHYDMVLLIDIFGTAFDLPENVSASCHDINQDIAKHCGISEKDAFNECREDIVSGNGISIDGKKHNALYDAKIIKAMYEITHR